MSDVLNEIKAYVDEKLPIYESEQEEVNELFEDDFNPCDASGGNFDDAYELGDDHGDTYGRLAVLREIKAIIEKESV
jgi:hypothetical protein